MEKKKTTLEQAIGITRQTKKKASPEKILLQNRKHWSIENKMHYVLGVTFDEDRSQIRKLNGPLGPKGPMVMTCLRRYAISLLRLKGKKNIAQAFRNLWAKPHNSYPYGHSLK